MEGAAAEQMRDHPDAAAPFLMLLRKRQAEGKMRIRTPQPEGGHVRRTVFQEDSVRSLTAPLYFCVEIWKKMHYDKR